MPYAGPKTGTEASAVQVLDVTRDHSFTLSEAALERILLDPKIRDSKVVVLSVVGAFRKGKSFLLDFFLRYLHDPDSENWTGDPDAPFKRFPWIGGPERYTAGIVMWNEPIPVELPSGEKAFLLLMDTQGASDSHSTVKDCATIFALSAMLSSIVVYNISSNIEETDLQHLQYFTDYGRLALENNGIKPFQDLYLLVRDWQYPNHHQYGWTGGDQLLQKRLHITDGQREEHRLLRCQLPLCFTKIECCLLPYPGSKVATNPEFDGRLSDIKENFKVHVREFVNHLLSPQCLSVKEVNGTRLTGKELLEYFKVYTKIFQDNKLPEPRSIFQATVEANNLAAVAQAKDFYTRHMEKIAGGDKGYVEPEILKRKHDRHAEAAVKLFRSLRKMGGEEQSKTYLDQLKIYLEAKYKEYVVINSARKPTLNGATFAAGAIIGAAAVGFITLIRS